MFNAKQRLALLHACEVYKSMTEDCIASYGDIPGHAKEVLEMKEELKELEAIMPSLK